MPLCFAHIFWIFWYFNMACWKIFALFIFFSVFPWTNHQGSSQPRCTGEGWNCVESHEADPSLWEGLAGSGSIWELSEGRKTAPGHPWLFVVFNGPMTWMMGLGLKAAWNGPGNCWGIWLSAKWVCITAPLFCLRSLGKLHNVHLTSKLFWDGVVVFFLLPQKRSLQKLEYYKTAT